MSAALKLEPEWTTSAHPSREAMGLANASLAELEQVFLRGATPALAGLLGWEFRGINATPRGLPPFPKLLGIRKFVKGMYADEHGRAMGYNTPVAQNVLDGRWRAKAKRFGFYTVDAVDATARDNAYLHALLLDYGKGGNPRLDVSRGLRDYLVQLAPDRYLGKAYYAVGAARLPVGFFILERWRRAQLPVER